MKGTKLFPPKRQLITFLKKVSLLCILIFLFSSLSYAQNAYSVNDAGADDGCDHAWPPEILGNYYENGTRNGKPCYEGPNGYWLYNENMTAAGGGIGAGWAVGKPLGTKEVNNNEVRFFQICGDATPPLNTNYESTNNGCGLIRVGNEGALPPPAPTLYNPSNVGSTSMDLSWSQSPAATGYHVYVSTNNTFTEMVDGLNPKDVPRGGLPSAPTTTNISGLNKGTTYYIRVRAYSGAGESGNSNTVSAATAPDAPVANNASNISDQTFQANWNASAGATYYKLYVSTNSEFSSHVAGYNGRQTDDETSYEVTGLNANTTYYYRLKAYNSTGGSGYSNSKSLTTVPPPPVTNDATGITQTSFDANWTSSAQATGYYLDVATNSNFNNKVNGYDNRNVGNVTTCNVTGLSAGTTYYFRLRSYNAVGTSGNSSTKSVITISAAPTATDATVIHQTSFSANWNSSSGATGYRLDVATDAGFINLVIGYDNLDVSNVTTYSVNTNLTSNTAYYYRVRAYNSGGTSSSSNTITLTTAPSPPTTQAQSVVFSNIYATQMKIDWTNGNGANRVVFIKEGSADNASPSDYTTYTANTHFKSGTQIGATGWYCIYNSNGTTVTVNGLMPGTSYRVMVCEYNGTGGLEAYNSNSASNNPSNQTMVMVLINEMDSDTPGADDKEFIELYDGGVGNISLNGLTIVLYNGNGDVSYNKFDLDGSSTDANGYFLLGNAGVTGADITFANSTLQNGADAVALYAADGTDFPNGTAVTTTGLVDAIVYDNGEADDAGLLILLNGGEPQVNENGRSLGTFHSVQRIPNGSGGLRNTSTYVCEEPSPKSENILLAVITVEGNSTLINDGDITPDAADHTVFTNVAVNGGTTTRTYTIKNSGLTDLTIDDVRITGADASDFSVTTDPVSPVGTNGSTTFTITFNPSAAGTRNATINIDNNDSDRNPYNFDIQGDGLIPDMVVSSNGNDISNGDAAPSVTDNTDFGTADLSAGSVSHSFTITNNGTVALNLSGGNPYVSITGTHPGDFTVTSVPSQVVASGGGTTTFTIKFDPSGNGLREATISITSDDLNDTPYTFGIQGTGGDYPEIQIEFNGTEIVDGDAIPGTSDGTDFGQDHFNLEAYSPVHTFQIINLGSSVLNLGGAPRVTVAGVDLSLIEDAPLSIAAGDTAEFKVKFAATATVVRNGTISITNDDNGENPYNFSITGTGYSGSLMIVQGGNPQLDIEDGDATPRTEDYTAFGRTVAGGGTIDRIFEIENFGAAALNLTDIPVVSIGGANAGDFTVTDQPSSPVASGGNDTFTIQFAPGLSGTKTAIVSIANNDPNRDPYTFTISGDANSAPVLDNIEISALVYAEEDNPANITNNITVTDLDDILIESAEIKFTAGYNGNEDLLSFTNQNGITGVWNGVNGILSLTGSSSLANYQTALRSVTYQNGNNADPDNTTRTISFKVNDGDIDSGIKQRNINVIDKNDAPLLASIEGTSIDYTENDPPVKITNTITVNDVDDANIESATVQITGNYCNGEDELRFANQNGITGAWNVANGSLILTGTASVSNYNVALKEVSYFNSSPNPNGEVRTISFLVNDGSDNSNTVTRNIVIYSVNNPPQLSAIESNSIIYKIKQSRCQLSKSISITDIDDYYGEGGVVSISENYKKGEDKLILEVGGDITGSWDEENGRIILTGHSSVDHYQWALRNLYYSNSSTTPTTGERTISFVYSDGKDNSNTVTRKIEIVSAVNIPPVISQLEQDQLEYLLLSPPIIVSDSLVISDEDDMFLQSGEVKIEEGFLYGEDVLACEAPIYLKTTYNWLTGTLTITGQGELAAYQNIFRSVKYRNIKGINATNSTKTIVFSVTDGSRKSSDVIRQIYVEGTTTDVAEVNEIPKEYILYQNYPNPFNPSTKLRYGLPKASDVHLSVVNILGEVVKTLYVGNQNAGYHEYEFSAGNLPSGIYFFRIVANEFSQTKKMLLIK